jgi:NAD(P)-dependent dehydrogenase (short-subunit alcohol dehydrogenase family)
LTQELRNIGVEAGFIRADVCHKDEVRNLVDKTVARFGRLDVAVNNAGTEGKLGPVTEQTAESYASIFEYQRVRRASRERSGCPATPSSNLPLRSRRR